MMFNYLVRSNASKEVLGIINVQEVVGSFGKSNYVLILDIIEWNLNLGPSHWDVELITLPEYETYRDLHGFRVLTKPTGNEWLYWLDAVTKTVI